MSDELEFHPIANLFPMMDGEQWKEFKLDIEVEGVLDPVILYEGKILDGRNRYKAAEELGVECRFENYNGEDPLGYVLSHNLHRRHMDTGQRAAVAAKIANLDLGSNQHVTKEAGLIKPASEAPVSEKKAAELMNVSPDSVKRAKKVIQEATPEVVKALEEGKVTLNAAVKTLKPEAEEPEQEPLTEKQMDIRRTRDYQDLKKLYLEIVKQHEQLKAEHDLVLNELAVLRGDKETLNGEKPLKTAKAYNDRRYSKLYSVYQNKIAECASLKLDKQSLQVKLDRLEGRVDFSAGGQE